MISSIVLSLVIVRLQPHHLFIYIHPSIHQLINQSITHSLSGNGMEEELSGGVTRRDVDGSGEVVVRLTMQACSRE